MKLTKFMAGFGAALLVVACDVGSGYSAFTSYASFEYQPSLASQLAMTECRADSLIVLDNALLSGGSMSTGLAFKNAKISGDSTTIEPGFLVTMQKDNTLEEGYHRRFASFNARTSGYESFACAVYTDVYGSTAPHGVTFLATDQGTANFLGFYVNNTNEVVNLVTYGSDKIEPFGPGERLVLTVTAHPSMTKKEIVLAERTETELKVIKEWQEVKIDDVKNFTYLDFKVTCEDQEGRVQNRENFPLNVCIDVLTAFIELGEKK